jgi:hypothetical protein
MKRKDIKFPIKGVGYTHIDSTEPGIYRGRITILNRKELDSFLRKLYNVCKKRYHNCVIKEEICDMTNEYILILYNGEDKTQREWWSFGNRRPFEDPNNKSIYQFIPNTWYNIT